MSLREPFQFRYVREIVGVFVLGALALSLFGLLVLGQGRRWFEKKAEVVAVFEAEKSTVLHAGMPVRLAGERVGAVTAVVVKGAEARATLLVRAASLAALRSDSLAILRVPIAGLVGELSIELTPGSSGPPLVAGATLPGRAQGDLLGEAEKVFHQLTVKVPILTDEVERLLVNVNGLLEDARRRKVVDGTADVIEDTHRILRRVEAERLLARAGRALDELDGILAAVNRGEGTAGALVKDPALHGKVNRLLDDVHHGWGDIEKLLAAGGKLGDDASAITAELRRRAGDVPAIIDQTERLLLRTNQTLEALQRHWLLRGTIEAGAPPPIPPAVLDRPREPAEAEAPAVAPVPASAPAGDAP